MSVLTEAEDLKSAIIYVKQRNDVDAEQTTIQNLRRLHMFQFQFGKRLFKTAVAAFITAQICYLLNWPMIFAVIAAIVSIEPTVDASIRKGIIRFPAAALGAAFAMIFDAWLGPQPLTFMLSVLSTIYVCNLLRWNHAIVISTLTSVNMISVSEGDFLMEFVVRLGTTITGIVVSAAVNYLLFRPEYLSEIKTTMTNTYTCIVNQARQVLDKQVRTVNVDSITASLNSIQRLLEYQFSDIRYKKRSIAELRELIRIQQNLRLLRRIVFYMETAVISKDENERTECYRLLATRVRQLQEKRTL